MGMKFDSMPLKSDSMKTPAYPSGHSLQSRLIAEYYAEKYPEHKELIDRVDECGMGIEYLQVGIILQITKQVLN